MGLKQSAYISAWIASAYIRTILVKLIFNFSY